MIGTEIDRFVVILDQTGDPALYDNATARAYGYGPVGLRVVKMFAETHNKTDEAPVFVTSKLVESYE